MKLSLSLLTSSVLFCATIASAVNTQKRLRGATVLASDSTYKPSHNDQEDNAFNLYGGGRGGGRGPSNQEWSFDGKTFDGFPSGDLDSTNIAVSKAVGCKQHMDTCSIDAECCSGNCVEYVAGLYYVCAL